MDELTQLRTENGKMFDAGKDAKTGRPNYTLEARTGPIHYKSAYKDTDPWLDLDETYFEEDKAGLVYPKMPNIVTVYQDRCGYQIQSRSNPDHVAKVELVSIDGQAVTAWQDSAALRTYAKVHPYRVGIWKDFSAASKAKSTTMRWKITELGNATKDSHPFAFRDKPEAFSTADIDSLMDRESARVAIQTARTRIDDSSWYWDELIPAEAKLVDTDWQVGADANDGHWFATGYFYATYSPNHSFGNAPSSAVHAWLRFTSVGMAKGATIHSAKCSLCAYMDNAQTTCNARISHNAADNAVAPTNKTEADALSLSTAYADWSGVPAWIQDTWYDTPSLVSSTQEIVNRTGWASGNAMMLLIKDNSSSADARRNLRSYYGSTSKAAKYLVTWTETMTVFPYYYNNMRP